METYSHAGVPHEGQAGDWVNKRVSGAFSWQKDPDQFLSLTPKAIKFGNAEPSNKFAIQIGTVPGSSVAFRNLRLCKADALVCEGDCPSAATTTTRTTTSEVDIVVVHG